MSANSSAFSLSLQEAAVAGLVADRRKNTPPTGCSWAPGALPAGFCLTMVLQICSKALYLYCNRCNLVSFSLLTPRLTAELSDGDNNWGLNP